MENFLTFLEQYLSTNNYKIYFNDDFSFVQADIDLSLYKIFINAQANAVSIHCNNNKKCFMNTTLNDSFELTHKDNIYNTLKTKALETSSKTNEDYVNELTQLLYQNK